MKREYQNQQGKKEQVTYKGTSLQLSADFLTETLQVRRKWHDIFKVMKVKTYNQKVLLPDKLSFRFDGKLKSFTNKKKLRVWHR